MRIAILGNHPGDPRESMHRFARLLQEGLVSRGLEAVLLQPETSPGRGGRWHNRLEKWRFEQRLRRLDDERFDLVHVADQGNAWYAAIARSPRRPAVVTCHDLSALEDRVEPRGGLDRIWHSILSQRLRRGLQAASLAFCDSGFTLETLRRLFGPAAPPARVVHLGQQRSYQRLSRAECAQRLRDKRLLDRPFLLHVGANYARKNRAVLVQALSLLDSSEFRLVFAGDPPDAALLASAGAGDRLITVPHPDDRELEALYSSAFALLFPSTYEGFGWPVIEAQSCGCPVICSNATSLPEIGGAGALYHDPSEAGQIVQHILSLRDPAFRDALVAAGLQNAARFTTDRMLDGYLSGYTTLLRPTSSPVA